MPMGDANLLRQIVKFQFNLKFLLFQQGGKSNKGQKNPISKKPNSNIPN